MNKEVYNKISGSDKLKKKNGMWTLRTGQPLRAVLEKARGKGLLEEGHLRWGWNAGEEQ